MVWHQLKHCVDYRDPTLQETAYLVALEFAKIAMGNFRVIKNELDRVGYEFSNPDNALVEARSGALDEIDEFERANGKLPIILKAWYSVFHSIDFTQKEQQIKCFDNTEDSLVMGLGFNCQLIYKPFQECANHIEPSFRDGVEELFFPSGMNATNCDPKGMDFPTDSFDATFYNEGSGNVGFGDEVRFICHACGFTYWKLVHNHVFDELPELHATPKYTQFCNQVRPYLNPL